MQILKISYVGTVDHNKQLCLHQQKRDLRGGGGGGQRRRTVKNMEAGKPWVKDFGNRGIKKNQIALHCTWSYIQAQEGCEGS